MSAFWKSFLNAAIAGAVQTAAATSQTTEDPKTVGISAGVGAFAGILQFLVSHPSVPVNSTPVVTLAPTTIPTAK